MYLVRAMLPSHYDIKPFVGKIIKDALPLQHTVLSKSHRFTDGPASCARDVVLPFVLYKRQILLVSNRERASQLLSLWEV